MQADRGLSDGTISFLGRSIRTVLSDAEERELQRLDIEDLERAKDRTSLPEVRRGGKAVDVDQLLRQKVRHDKS